MNGNRKADSGGDEWDDDRVETDLYFDEFLDSVHDPDVFVAIFTLPDHSFVTGSAPSTIFICDEGLLGGLLIFKVS